jgi:hypothetical protein
MRDFIQDDAALPQNNFQVQQAKYCIVLLDG